MRLSTPAFIKHVNVQEFCCIYPQGAKNHGVIMPDANKEHTINQLVGAAFGAAGQRCMALSTAVFVGKAKEWIPEIVERAKQLKVNEGMQSGADLGPLISPEAKKRVLDLVQSGVDEGAKVSSSQYIFFACNFLWAKIEYEDPV